MSTDPYAQGKRAAAFAAVNELIPASGMRVGVGTGSTAAFVVTRLAERVKAEAGFKVICVPTSFSSRALLLEEIKGGLEDRLVISDLDRHPVLDVVIDGADECDSKLNCIKGGGGAQTQEKIVAAAGKLFCVVADDRKAQQVLGTTWRSGIPLEVIPMAHVPVMKRISDMGGKPVLRMAKAKAGPCVTDNGNFIVDADFGPINDPDSLNRTLSLIPGIVETGLFVGMASIAYFGRADGTVLKLTSS